MLITSRLANGRCPCCGAEHAACGPPSASVPFDLPEEVAVVGGPLKKYRIRTAGTETVMKFNDADAAARGLTDADLADAPKPEGAAEPASKARTAARNKARTTSATKAGGGGD
ncbi:hypothetical protein [Streptomyces sp. URMC 124]|uniref:hypothetical protein n=1 Tax=Streptomyces sp. URMC 124 TaxID=3423405 RepID=UPI003F19B6FD